MVGDKILKFSRVYAIILTILLIIGGLVLIIVGAAHREVDTSSYWRRDEPAPIVGMIVGGALCYPSIIFVWIQKLFIDGFGLIVLSSENNLKKDGVKTYLDEVREKKERDKQYESSVW